MVVPFRTFAVFSLAFGMLAAGYLIGPAPGATHSSPSPTLAGEAAAPKAAAPTLVANRPPVPLVRPQPTNYFTTTAQDSGASGDKPAVDAGASNGDPAQAQTAALTTDQPSGNDADARKAIEFDGYKNVHGIVKDADGVWHAHAMRGRTEIAVRVDGSGNVSAE
jgi:hypothetical protein